MNYLLGGLGLAAIGMCVVLVVARRRVRAHRRAAEQTLEALIQGIQGLVLNLQVLLGELRPDDGLRLRFECLLDDIESLLAAAGERAGAERAVTDTGQS